MALSSGQLEAFSAVAKARSFSIAAKNLHVTQSALSQRISNLEKELATALIVRDPAGLRLTAAGEELLRYCRVKENLETEVLSNISSAQLGLKGVVRVGAFSSVMRSIVIPAVDQIVNENPYLNIELLTREVRDLPKMLANNEVDLIITIEEPSRQDIRSHLLGHELNVLVESARGKSKRKEIYLDHDSDDETTKQFFAANNSQLKLHRNYLDEIYSIIDGVKRGWGRAVLPKHLVELDRGLRIVKNYKPVKVPVILQYFSQPFYSNLFTIVVEELLKHGPELLRP